MWRWIKRWADWLRNDQLPLSRIRRGGSSVAIRHESAGGSSSELPVPWSAETVIIEVQFRLPTSARRRSDFLLILPGYPPAPAETIRPEHGNRHRIVFRVPTPSTTLTGEVVWMGQPVANVTIPILSADEFLSSVRLTSPTLAVRRAGQVVPTRLFVLKDARGLVASVGLASTHPLASMAELGLTAVFRHERSGRAWEVPVALSTEERRKTETVAIVASPKRPRRLGVWTVTWRVRGRELAGRWAEAITSRRFEEIIRVADARFLVGDKSGAVRVCRQVPPLGSFDRLGPCFLIASGESGAVGACRLSLLATSPGEASPFPLITHEILITDAPVAFAPGLFTAEQLARVGGFELRLHERVIGTVSLSPVPPATLTAEGGFKPPGNFTWTAAAEQELLDRLSRLGGDGLRR